MDNQALILIDHISEMSSYHKKVGSWDFLIAQTLLCAGILTSVAAGILAVIWTPQTTRGKTGKIILASIPALVISTEQSFKFCQRYQWHDEYHAKLHSLENSLRFENASVEAVSRKESELARDMLARFPSMTFQTIPAPEQNSGKIVTGKDDGPHPPP